MKLLRARTERTLSSLFFAVLKVDTKRFSKQTRAAPRIPVSGRTLSMWISHVADTKHAKHNSLRPLSKPSDKASNSRPNSWLTKADATFLSQSSAALSSSSCCKLNKTEGTLSSEKLLEEY